MTPNNLPVAGQESLRVRALRGMAWRFGTAFGGFFLQMARAIILARLLVPEDFGLVGMATGVVLLLGMFTDVGFTTALIQAPDLRQRSPNSAFWAQVLVAMVVLVVAWALSRTLAGFYGDQRLVLILWWLAIGISLNGALTVPLAMMQRELRFKEINLMWGVLRVFSFCLAVVMAATGWEYWSLVVPDLAIATLALAFLLWKQPALLRPHFHFASLRPLFRVSAKSFLNRCLATLNTNVDYVILGRFFTPANFGFYFFGYRRIRGPLKIGTMSVRGALFPAMSRVQHNPNAARRAFRQGVPILSLALFPIATLIILTAPQFVPLVFGTKWTPAAPLIQMFTVWAFFIPVNLIVTSAFTARARFAPVLIDGSARAVLIVAGLIALGLGGRSIYLCGLWVVLVEVAGNSFLAVWGLKSLQISGRECFRLLKAPALAASVIVFADELWRPLLPASATAVDWCLLLTRTAQAFVLTLAVTWAVDRDLLRHARHTVAEILPQSWRRPSPDAQPTTASRTEDALEPSGAGT